MPSKHAKLSASSAFRWINCPGSVALADQLPAPGSSAYADEGTLAHALAELKLQMCIRDSPTGHKQSKFKVFLIIFIVGIVGFGWSDDQGVREFEGLGHPTLIGSITSGQTLHFYDQDAIIDA